MSSARPSSENQSVDAGSLPKFSYAERLFQYTKDLREEKAEPWFFEMTTLRRLNFADLNIKLAQCRKKLFESEVANDEDICELRKLLHEQGTIYLTTNFKIRFGLTDKRVAEKQMQSETLSTSALLTTFPSRNKINAQPISARDTSPTLEKAIVAKSPSKQKTIGASLDSKKHIHTKTRSVTSCVSGCLCKSPTAKRRKSTTNRIMMQAILCRQVFRLR